MAKKTSSWSNSVGNALSMATGFAAAVALGYFSGNWLDDRFGTEPWLMLIMSLLGLGAGLKLMYDQAGKMGFGRSPSDPVAEDQDEPLDYQPSKEIVAVLGEAKKKLAQLEKAGAKELDDEEK